MKKSTLAIVLIIGVAIMVIVAIIAYPHFKQSQSTQSSIDTPKQIETPTKNNEPAIEQPPFEDKKDDDNTNQNKLNYGAYSDTIINPFTNEEYMIGKAWDEGCGMNGSTVCDLVVTRTDGSMEKLTSLFFPYKGTEKYFSHRSGTELIAFEDSKTIIIKYSLHDHGGGNSYISSYNISTQQVSDYIVNFGVVEGMVNGDYANISYFVCNQTSCLEFINSTNDEYIKTFDQNGIYLTNGEDIAPIATDITHPYTVEFDVTENYQHPEVINLVINSIPYEFNFTNKQLTASK